MTERLVESLAGDLRPARRRFVTVRLAGAVAAGFTVSLAGVLWRLGPRDDMLMALGTMMFWTKLAYAGAIAWIGVLGVERVARPTGRPGRRLAWLAAPLTLIALTAAVQVAEARPGALRALIMGESAAVCPWYIALTAAPVFAALVWAVRGLAPTRLRLAGALTGLAAGGFAALAYCLHCPESGAPFVAAWYSLGMLIPAVVGALLGPRLLRW